MTRRWLCVSLLLLSAGAASGCDDECKKGKSECVSETLIRTCVPGEDENSWLVHQCGDDETCHPDVVPPGGSRDGGSGTGAFGAACVGTCVTGESECVSAELARYCVNDKVWELDPCAVGEQCVDGVCRIGTDGGVRACVPGAKACASERVEKVCDADGTAWVERTCPLNQICLGSGCVANPSSSCDEGNRCLDNKTALRCLGEDKGFELVSCTGTTWCEGGRCRGDNCSIGSDCVNLTQVRECSDGVNFVDTQCGANEVCHQERDSASCEARVCVPGVNVCGDPEDESIDETKFYSQCVIGPNTGIPGWQRGECTGNLLCDPVFAASGNPCRQACTPGAEICASDPNSGIQDGFRVCQEDGTWGPVQNCNSGGDSRLQCALRQNPEASDLPTHICAEPVCAYLFNGVGFGGGTCDGSQIRRCTDDGQLEDAADCETGLCRVIGTPVLSDGRLPGACDEDIRCMDGEERCVDSGFTPTPLFQVCEGGEWSSAFKTCEGDTLCLDYFDAEGLSRKLCDAECAPGQHRCNSDGDLQTCGATGDWGGTTSCSLGRCQATGSNDAACVLDCVPGETACTGIVTLASDNVSQGMTMEVACNTDGTFATPVTCGTGEACRTTSTGVTLGCVACLGPNAPGGNDQGLVDSRCDPAMIADVQSCGSGNTWSASRACQGGKTCIGPSGPTCGTCLSTNGNTVVCTESNIDDFEICGTCLVPLDDAGTQAQVTCTETNIQTVNAAQSCASLFGGSTTSWGGFADCCNGSAGAYLLTSGVTCASRGYGIPTVWGGEPDCCSSFQQAAGGPSFAYCGP